MTISRWLSSTLWTWTTNLRRTPSIAKAQQRKLRASMRRCTQDQHKADMEVRAARHGGLYREAADHLAARRQRRAEARARNAYRIEREMSAAE